MERTKSMNVTLQKQKTSSNKNKENKPLQRQGTSAKPTLEKQKTKSVKIKEQEADTGFGNIDDLIQSRKEAQAVGTTLSYFEIFDQLFIQKTRQYSQEQQAKLLKGNVMDQKMFQFAKLRIQEIEKLVKEEFIEA